MFNMSAYNTNNFSVGGGILFIGPVGKTPTMDVGATRAGAVLSVKRTKERVMTGSPAHLIDGIATEETVTFSITGMEWNLSNISRAVGAGVTSHTGSLENIGFGGESDFDALAILFRHVTKAGHTVYIKLWKATGEGNMDINFGANLHEFPFVFEAHDATTDWVGDSLGQNRRLFEIERIKQ